MLKAMESSRFNNNRFVHEQEEYENSPENSEDSPRFPVSNDIKVASTSSSKRSRRGSIKKHVVSVPIKDVEGLRLKGDHMSAPPSDSWAWRKYGQKPIKGSPYPRGYYRCSSSKGCPARKQVERSRVDPNMLVVAYSCEHNHPLPASRNSHHATTTGAGNITTSVSEEDEEEQEEIKPTITLTTQIQEPIVDQDKFTNLGPLINAGEFGWFTDFEFASNFTTLESPITLTDDINHEMDMILTMREDDESLFADLGELPECSTVFRRGAVKRRRTAEETMCLPV